MKNFNYLFLALLATAIAFLGCKKVHDCTPGEKQYLDNPTEMQKSAKSDPCEFERIAVQVADSLLNQVYGPDVRNAIHPALYEPDNIAIMYWEAFNNNFVSQGTLLDSVEKHIVIIEGLWTISNPFWYNDENLRKLYTKCGIYVAGAQDLQAKQGALEDCENGVPVIEIKPTYICDDNGNWINLITGKRRGDQ